MEWGHRDSRHNSALFPRMREGYADTTAQNSALGTRGLDIGVYPHTRAFGYPTRPNFEHSANCNRERALGADQRRLFKEQEMFQRGSIEEDEDRAYRLLLRHCARLKNILTSRRRVTSLSASVFHPSSRCDSLPPSSPSSVQSRGAHSYGSGDIAPPMAFHRSLGTHDGQRVARELPRECGATSGFQSPKKLFSPATVGTSLDRFPASGGMNLELYSSSFGCGHDTTGPLVSECHTSNVASGARAEIFEHSPCWLSPLASLAIGKLEDQHRRRIHDEFYSQYYAMATTFVSVTLPSAKRFERIRFGLCAQEESARVSIAAEEISQLGSITGVEERVRSLLVTALYIGDNLGY